MRLSALVLGVTTTIVKASERLRVYRVPREDFGLSIKKKRGIKLDLWNHLRGLKETRSFRTPQQRYMFRFGNRTPVNKSPCSLRLFVICFPSPSLKFSCLIFVQSLMLLSKCNSTFKRSTSAGRTYLTTQIIIPLVLTHNRDQSFCY
jgi:hypothetical protein